MKRVYISGKITGCTPAEIEEKFGKAERYIELIGHKPVSPRKNGLPFTEAWETHMVKDIEILFGCDAIYLLPCWKDSKGARIEKHIAEVTGKHIIHEDERGIIAVSPLTANQLIIDTVCRIVGGDFVELTSTNKKQELVYGRILLAFLLGLQGMSTYQIAALLHRDRTTVIWYATKYIDELEYNPEFRTLANQVANELQNQLN